MDFGSFRSIQGDTILSPSLPRLGIQISPDFVYLGKLYYISADTHHIEQFIFLSPNGLGHVTRVLLIQFAGFLGNKEGIYEYSPHQSIQLAGETYPLKTETIDIDDFLKRFPGTDLAHAADYIRQRSYTLAGDMVSLRFAHEVSTDWRNEFVITYLETSQPEAAKPDENSKDETAASLDHALNSFRIIPFDSATGNR